jgi:chitin deacetylase
VPDADRGVLVRGRLKGFTEKVIALTFDDGPSENITPQILAALKAHQAKATFFVLGKMVRASPEQVKQIVADGHAIGIHSYSHSLSPPMPKAVEEMEKTRRLLKEAVGRETFLFRPPYGKTNGSHARLALQQKYAVLLWSKTGADTGTTDADVVRDNVAQDPQPGDIVLMHDCGNKQHTATALPQILERLEKAGYSFVTVPELLRKWDAWKRQHPKTLAVDKIKRAGKTGARH